MYTYISLLYTYIYIYIHILQTRTVTLILTSALPHPVNTAARALTWSMDTRAHAWTDIQVCRDYV